MGWRGCFPSLIEIVPPRLVSALKTETVLGRDISTLSLIGLMLLNFLCGCNSSVIFMYRYFISTVKWLCVAFQDLSFSQCKRRIIRTNLDLLRRFLELILVKVPTIQEIEKIMLPSYLYDEPESQRKRSLLIYSYSPFLIFLTRWF